MHKKTISIHSFHGLAEFHLELMTHNINSMRTPEGLKLIRAVSLLAHLYRWSPNVSRLLIGRLGNLKHHKLGVTEHFEDLLQKIILKVAVNFIRNKNSAHEQQHSTCVSRMFTLQRIRQYLVDHMSSYGYREFYSTNPEILRLAANSHICCREKLLRLYLLSREIHIDEHPLLLADIAKKLTESPLTDYVIGRILLDAQAIEPAKRRFTQYFQNASGPELQTLEFQLAILFLAYLRLF